MGFLRLILRVSIQSLTRADRSAGSYYSDPQRTREPRRPSDEVPGTLSGRCYVIDGDTIVIRRTKIRLAGIDAPELDQPWGQKAKWAMVGLCKGQIVTAELTGERSYDRLVATCFLPDGRDIGAELIKLGLALDGGHFTNGKYRHLEPEGVRRRIMRSRFRT